MGWDGGKGNFVYSFNLICLIQFIHSETPPFPA